MAIDFYLIAENGECVRKFLSKASGTRGYEVEFNEQGVTLAVLGLTGTTFAASPLSQELISVRFQFVPAMVFAFRIDKFDLFDAGMASMTTIVAQTIKESVDDCILMYEDVPILLRSRNTILADTGEDPKRLLIIERIASELGVSWEAADLAARK